MNTRKLYHIGREIASGFTEFCAAALLVVEVLTVWSVIAHLSRGGGIPAWILATSACAAVVLILAAVTAAAYRLPRMRVRVGVIDAQTICRVMEERK